MAGLLYKYTVVFCFVLTYLVNHSASRMCYQCVDSGDDKDCQNAALLLNVTLPKPKKDDASEESEDGELWQRNKYYKDCENDVFNNTMCMIEVYSSNGVIKSYHRDCTDGKTFSFTGSDMKLPRLAKPKSNNETTCSYYATGNVHVCLQICDSDMCNGPIFPKEPEVVCYNITDEFGDNRTICGASTLSNFLTHGTLNVVFGGLFGYSAVLPFLIYVFFILLLV